MERAVIRKAWSDLLGHRLQSILIVLTIAAATATLTVALVSRAGVADPFDRAFKASNGAHVIVTSFPFRPGDPVADLSPVAEMPGVAEMSGPVPVVNGAALIVDGLKQNLDLAALGTEPPAVGRPILTDGAWLSGGAGEILLTRDFARDIGVHTGDTVEVVGFGGTPVPVTVVGLTVDVSRGPFPAWEPIGYLSEATLAKIVPDRSRWSSAVAVRLDDPLAVGPFAVALRQQFPDYRLNMEDWLGIKNDFTIWPKVFSILLGLFAGFAMLAVGMIVANVIGARVLSQFRDIGMMKAVGFTPGQIVRVFLVQHLLLALAGGLLGIALGTLAAPLMLDRTSAALNTTRAPVFVPTLAGAILLGALLVVAVATWLPARRGARIPAVQAITSGAGTPVSRPSLPARLALRLRLSPPVALGVKDAFARPWRATMTVVALTLTAITLIFTLGTHATLDGILNDPALEGDAFDVAIFARGTSEATMNTVLANHPEIANLYTYTGTAARGSGSNATANTFLVRGVEGGYDRAGFLVPDGRMFSAPGEGVAGKALLDMLGAQVGDTVTVDVLDIQEGHTVAGTLTIRIVGRFVTDDEDGRVLMIPRETLQTVIPNGEPQTYAVQLRPGANLHDFQAAVYRETSYAVGMETGIDDTPPEATILTGVLYGLSGVLLVIGMINLVSTTLLNVRERRRDIGIGKALGMTPRQVTTSVVTGVSLLAALAAVVGIPLGVLVYRAFYEIIAIGMLDAERDWYAGPSWWSLALMVPGAVVVAALASSLPARLAARVQVSEALRAE